MPRLRRAARCSGSVVGILGAMFQPSAEGRGWDGQSRSGARVASELNCVALWSRQCRNASFLYCCAAVTAHHLVALRM